MNHSIGPLPSQIESFASRLPTMDGQIHACTAAGIGDIGWLWSKWHAVAAKRQVKVWMPAGEFERSGQLCEMYGIDYGFMPGLTSGMCWDYWDKYGDPPIPDSGGVIVVSANRHLEQGRRLERWYPELPWKNPVPETKCVPYINEVGGAPYVIVAMGSHGYHADRELIGNLCPGIWVRILTEIEQKIAPVVLQFSARSEHLARAVMKIWNPTIAPASHNPFPVKLAVMKGARAILGTHSGDTMMAAWAGIPTMHLYPRWLKNMVGMWDGPTPLHHGWCFVDEAMIPGVVDALAILVANKELASNA